MLDPRIELANMVFEMREKLMEIEMKLWDIPHHEEPVAEYDAVFTAPAEGDYLHPMTPTHEKPEGFGMDAYWDECMQCWMEPTPYEWDEYNYCCNANCDVSYDMEANTWVEGEDWSNHYADDWYAFPESNVEFVEGEVHHDDHHEVETAPVLDPAPMTDEAPAPEGNIA
jgi:hypothetical protein